MKATIRIIIVAIVATLALTVPTAANAYTFNDSYKGTDSGTTTTTLNFAKSHGNFNLRIWITRAGLPQFGVSTNYTIQMYDKQGRQLWSANNQGDRTYYVGSNVAKIKVTPKTKWPTLTTRWQKK
jgi:hypothetical protein